MGKEETVYKPGCGMSIFILFYSYHCSRNPKNMTDAGLPQSDLFPCVDTDGTEDRVVADSKKYNLERCGL